MSAFLAQRNKEWLCMIIWYCLEIVGISEKSPESAEKSMDKTSL